MEMLNTNSLLAAAMAAPLSRAEKAEMEPPQDLSQNETEQEQPENDKPYQIRSDVAIAEGWAMSKPAPEPTTCQFCGKTLYHYGIKEFTGKKQVFVWFEEPEHCTCEQAQEYWKEQARLKAEAEAAKKRQEEADRIQRRVTKLIKDSGIRGRFANRTFDRFEVNEINRKAYEKCKRYADSFPIMLPDKDERGNAIPPQKERNGLFITGSYGTGKTHLACAIANQLMQGGTPTICMTMIDLLAKIKNSFESNENATEAEIMRLYEEIPLLVIDDIGSEQPTEWGITRIYAIINARYEAYMPTIVTTNYTADDLIRRMTPSFGGKLGDVRNAEKTLDRLREMCVGIEMYWESWRTK